ncbi:hypothetical protein NDU88_001926 [Pleurodeles waltl]|uniref:Uncharacterized protein n=1 Tax=Pleurodeles waltl TaxID=8319 RepID=A0AAV7P820_PLEWA|nr:hypothetical protein NDU88_001926 [Pleurodeles waltl]
MRRFPATSLKSFLPRRLTAPRARAPFVSEGVAQQGLNNRRAEEGEGRPGHGGPFTLLAYSRLRTSAAL